MGFDFGAERELFGELEGPDARAAADVCYEGVLGDDDLWMEVVAQAGDPELVLEVQSG